MNRGEKADSSFLQISPLWTVWPHQKSPLYNIPIT